MMAHMQIGVRHETSLAVILCVISGVTRHKMYGSFTIVHQMRTVVGNMT